MSDPVLSSEPRAHGISVVIPVYRGEHTLEKLVAEVADFGEITTTPNGRRFSVVEVLLVYDHGPDGSAAIIRQLDKRYPLVRPVWLSRNYGQHAATLAGMASTACEWIVTLDEDGQHDPHAIGRMLDVALDQQAGVVYASPTNPPPHGALRNIASKTAKLIFVRLLTSEPQPAFHSYRLMLGEIGRSVAAYAGSGVYLDVALGWVTHRFSTCPVEMRTEGDRRSGYSYRSLASHFWRLVLTSGTRPLRVVSFFGVAVAFLGFVMAVVVFIGRVTGRIDVEGWASLTVVLLVGIGTVLFTLGVVAEYIGVAVGMAMGKPPYLIVGDDEDGPLGRAGRRDG